MVPPLPGRTCLDGPAGAPRMKRDNHHHAPPSGPRIEALSAEYGGDGLVLGTTTPRLSWRLAPGPRDWLQAGYELRLQRAAGSSETGLVDSADSQLVPWPFAPLAARETASLCVRVHGVDGSRSAWSEPAALEVGLLGPGAWSASFVGPAIDGTSCGALPLRRTFSADRPVVCARLHVTALGVFEPYLNGRRVGDHVLDPGWTSYAHRLCYSTFDVTGAVRAGENVLGVVVADGWYRGRLGFNGGRREIYGGRLGRPAPPRPPAPPGSTAGGGRGRPPCARPGAGGGRPPPPHGADHAPGARGA